MNYAMTQQQFFQTQFSQFTMAQTGSVVLCEKSEKVVS